VSEPIEKPIHLWHRCAHHGQAPIVGKRYHCVDLPEGPDNDLCEKAYLLYRAGRIEFPPKDSFVKPPAGVRLRFECHEGQPPDGFLPWLEVPMAPDPPPALRHPFAVRPEFCAGFESAFGGHGFIASLEGRPQPLALTALHVMDEMIRKKHIDCSTENEAYTGRELPAVITKVNLYDLFAPRWMMASLGQAGPMLALPDARMGEEEPYSARDLAAFEIADQATAAKLRPLPLAPGPPAVGDPLWLAARNDQALDRRIEKAVVVHVDEGSLIYRYERAEDGAKYSSGAPLINRLGQAVAVNVGGGRFRGARFGHGCHAGAIRRHLASG